MIFLGAITGVKIDRHVLPQWLDEHEQENGPIIKRQRSPRMIYSPEQKNEAIQKVIQWFREEEDMTISEAARRLNVNRVTLKRWLNKYGQKYGFMNKKQNHPYTIYFQEEKTAIESIDH